MPSKALDLPFEIISNIFRDFRRLFTHLWMHSTSSRRTSPAASANTRAVEIHYSRDSKVVELDSFRSQLHHVHRPFASVMGPGRPDAILNLVDLWIMRDGIHPLSVTINCGGEENDYRTEHSHHAIRAISAPLPCLRKFIMHVQGDLGPGIFVAFPNAPQLEELRLSALYVHPVRLNLGLASRALTHLEMYHIITIQDCFDILHNFPQLLHFSAPEVTGTESHPWPAPASRIFPLQSLELWLDTRLLAVITLPQLQRLTPDSVNSDQLLAFLSRSHASIIYFDIRCEWYRCDRALELCIRVVPNVSVLRIQLEGPSDLDNIVSDQHVLNQSNIFPSLRTLHIRDYGHHPLPMPQPVSLLLGRCFRALSARGVRIQLENLSFELPEDLKLNESIKLDADPSNPFPPLDFL
ncbi:hypothetical protein C8J57DRAFT_1588686 [Mycena rebaudengoi]|nr:hypothetical protein C8J57DRAFT_1588686 [Mycena rebaudengoi]